MPRLPRQMPLRVPLSSSVVLPEVILMAPLTTALPDIARWADGGGLSELFSQ